MTIVVSGSIAKKPLKDFSRFPTTSAPIMNYSTQEINFMDTTVQIYEGHVSTRNQHIYIPPATLPISSNNPLFIAKLYSIVISTPAPQTDIHLQAFFATPISS